MPRINLNGSDQFQLMIDGEQHEIVGVVTREVPQPQPIIPLSSYTHDPLANHTYTKACLGLCGLCSCLGLIGGIAYGIINSISNNLSKMHD